MAWAMGNLLHVELSLSGRPPLGFGPAVSSPYSYMLANVRSIK